MQIEMFYYSYVYELTHQGHIDAYDTHMLHVKYENIFCLTDHIAEIYVIRMN